MKFKIGDRVRAVKRCDGRNLIGYEGTVKAFRTNNIFYSCTVGVEFDKAINGHSLDGRCKYEHGRWCEESSLELIKNETIVIYRKGNEVVALDKKTGKKVVAKCSPDDKFDFNVGAKLALERLTKNVTFRVLCIKDYRALSKKGKIYEFINGYTKWECGDSAHYKDFDELKEWNDGIDNYFVELKDGDDPAEILKKYEPIKVGDTVKVTNTGRLFTTSTIYFEKNKVPYDIACRYAYGDDLGYDRGIRRLDKTFKVVFVADNRCVIERADGKCYLIDGDGVKKC